MRTFGLHPTALTGANVAQKGRGTACEGGGRAAVTNPDFQVLTPASADQLERRFSNKSFTIRPRTSSSSAPTRIADAAAHSPPHVTLESPTRSVGCHGDMAYGIEKHGTAVSTGSSTSSASAAECAAAPSLASPMIMGNSFVKKDVADITPLETASADESVDAGESPHLHGDPKVSPHPQHPNVSGEQETSSSTSITIIPSTNANANAATAATKKSRALSVPSTTDTINVDTSTASIAPTVSASSGCINAQTTPTQAVRATTTTPISPNQTSTSGSTTAPHSPSSSSTLVVPSILLSPDTTSAHPTDTRLPCHAVVPTALFDVEKQLAAAERKLLSNDPAAALSIVAYILKHINTPAPGHHVITAAAATTTPTSGSNASPNSWMRSLESAHLIHCKALVALGEWHRARAACHAALAFSPKHFELLYLCGKVLLECGKPAEAVSFFSYAIEVKSDHLPSWLARGLTYHLHLKDLARAVSDFHTSIVLNPTYYKSFFYMGMVMTDLLRFDLAVEAYDRSIHLNDTYTESYFRRGVLHLQHHRLELAVGDFSKVVQLAPESAEAHYNLALAQHLLKRNVEAIASYKSCLQCQPTYLNALKNCAHAQSELGLYTEAYENYTTALSISNLDDATKLDIFMARGQVCERNDNPLQALADYTQAIQVRPTLDRAYTYRGFVHLQRGDLSLAIEDFTRAIELEPENARAWNNRGNARLHLQQYDLAILDFDQAISLCPTFTKALRNRGKALNLQLSLTDALDSLNMAASQPTASHDPDTFILRGVVHHALGNHMKALRDFTRAPEAHHRRTSRNVDDHTAALVSWLNLDAIIGTSTPESE